MIEYRLTKIDNGLLKILPKEGWEHYNCYDGVMYWKRTIKQTRTVKIEEESEERLEFITEFRKINNKGSYADTLIKKYHEVIKEKPHKEMMDKLKEYKQHLEVKVTKAPLQVGTYLNQKRYNDTYEITNVDYTTKRRDDIIKEQKIPPEYADIIIQEANAWDSTHGKTKEMTCGIFQNIIDKVYTK